MITKVMFNSKQFRQTHPTLPTISSEYLRDSKKEESILLRAMKEKSSEETVPTAAKSESRIKINKKSSTKT